MQNQRDNKRKQNVGEVKVFYIFHLFSNQTCISFKTYVEMAGNTKIGLYNGDITFYSHTFHMEP